MKLVIFDIDGTLARTTGVDDECFLRALHEELGIEEIECDWGSYHDTTDEGILQEICTRRLAGRVTPEQIRRFRRRYLELLRHCAAADPSRFAPVCGAPALLAAVQATPGWCVALATGAWRETAAVKLAAAGYEIPTVPLATSDDAISREAIVRCAVKRAVELYGGEPRQVVSVGDGVWDAQAARSLGIGFLAVCSNPSVVCQMSAEGVRHLVADFGRGAGGTSDCLEILRRACGPFPAGLLCAME